MMSHTLKDAATSTLDTMSHMVDDARGHLDHLPLLHHTTPWWRSRWTIAAAALVAVSGGWMLCRRRSDRRATDRAADRAASLAHTTGAAERAADAAAARVSFDTPFVA